MSRRLCSPPPGVVLEFAGVWYVPKLTIGRDPPSVKMYPMYLKLNLSIQNETNRQQTFRRIGHFFPAAKLDRDQVDRFCKVQGLLNGCWTGIEDRDVFDRRGSLAGQLDL
ncbi:hypothetical protein RRG08_016393 [Elysia crispata]|uniref:Uncharacterized protein n=1 Tax=Elysia crispata TaxID=231223 RepID=A0AAE0Y9Q4_9GAST|nr:hypothetical protein RRG08_016393 [Elysia crispata]